MTHLIRRIPLDSIDAALTAACGESRPVHLSSCRGLITCPDCVRVIENEVTQRVNVEVPT